ncbi:MAG TPA: phage protease [Thermoguttaceae bacterium]|nr:phage protease [Thermoguttaceae bacterium]
MKATNDRTAHSRLRAIVCEVAPDGEIPNRILLVPWGRVESQNGSFIVNDKCAAEIVNQFLAHGVDLPIDYEHQTIGAEYTAPDGKAPAAGWIKSLEVVEGEGIYGRIEWTAPAQTMIAAKEYRYLSPVVFVETQTLEAIELHSVALTNKPAIAGMRAIVNRISNKEDSDMEIPGMDPSGLVAELKLLLQLGDEATLEDLLGAIKSLAEKVASYEVTPEEGAALIEAIVEVAEQELTEEGGEAVATAAREGNGKAVASSLRLAINRLKHPKGMVAASAMTETNQRLAAAEAKLANIEFEKLVLANSSRLPPDKREGFRGLWDKDRKYAEDWLKSQPELVASKASAGLAATAAKPGGQADRHALIAKTRATLDEDRAKGLRVLGSERDAVNGILVANRQKPLTDEEATKYGLVA